jgi:hypothetical protein
VLIAVPPPCPPTGLRRRICDVQSFSGAFVNGQALALGAKARRLTRSTHVQQNPGALLTPSVRVYDVYDDENPPPHPGAGWTRFVCLSDTHSRRFPVPPGDVLLHSGDLSAHGTIHALRKTMDWLRELEHPAKVCVRPLGTCCTLTDVQLGTAGSLQGTMM